MTSATLPLKTISQRIASGAGAYGYAQAVSIGTQLLALPLFLHHWDMATYGYWLALTALPFYLSLADAGISTASCNRMIGLIAQGDRAAAQVVFQSAVAFLTSASLAVLLAGGVILLALPADLLSAPQWRTVILLLACSVLLGLFCSLAEVIYKATGGYAAGTYLVTTGRLVDWAGGIVGLITFGSYLGVAAVAFAARLGYTLFAIWLSQRRTPYLSWGLQQAKRSEVARAVAPGMQFLSISLTNALSLQGFTLLVAGTLGPAATAIFNTYRTIARIVVQVTGALSNPLWPELTSLQGSTQTDAFWRLYRRANLLGLAIALGGGLAVYLVSPYLLEVWTHGNIAFSSANMALFLLYAAACSASQVPRVVLMATNRHAGLAWKGMLAAAVSLLAAWLLWRSVGMAGVVGAMILGELLVWLVTAIDVRRLHAGSRRA